MRTHLRNRTRSTFDPNPVDYRTVLGMDSLPGRPTSAAQTTLSRIMTALDTNLLGTVHGGVIMKLVDDVAGAVAQRHSGGPAVTASMDEMAFLEPVPVSYTHLTLPTKA